MTNDRKSCLDLLRRSAQMSIYSPSLHVKPETSSTII